MPLEGSPEPSWRVPDPALLVLRRRLAVGWLLLLGGVAVAAAAFLGGRTAALVTALGAVALLVLVLRLVERQVRALSWAERDDDLLVRRGVLVRRLTVVPYGRMQFVDVTSGPLARRYDLATVTLHTAAAATDASVPGLRSAEAVRLRDRLAALGEARAAGV